MYISRIHHKNHFKPWSKEGTCSGRMTPPPPGRHVCPTGTPRAGKEVDTFVYCTCRLDGDGLRNTLSGDESNVFPICIFNIFLIDGMLCINEDPLPSSLSGHLVLQPRNRFQTQTFISMEQFVPSSRIVLGGSAHCFIIYKKRLTCILTLVKNPTRDPPNPDLPQPWSLSSSQK